MIQVNFKSLIAYLLGYHKLRTRKHIAWLVALFAPLQTIYTLFTGKRITNLYMLSITPQVCFLEKMLNDRYDNTERRIYINDAYRAYPTYIYLPDEVKPLWVRTAAENAPVFIHTRSETEAGVTDFIVNVPSAVPINDLEMRALLNSYKLAGKRYQINII